MIPTSSTTLLALGGQVAADAGDDASQRLSYVIIGLVVLAVLIAVATVVFWRLSRPDPVALESGIRWIPDPDASAAAAASAAPAQPQPSSNASPSAAAPPGHTGAAIDPPAGR